MAPTDQQILDQARQSLFDILAGRVEEFNDDVRAKTLAIDKLEKTIEKYETRVNDDGRQILKRLRQGAL